jgi:polyisoprenyl-phosphate glycosyltransferase
LRRVVIVVPLLNDWESCAHLANDFLAEVDRGRLPAPLELVISDDCSTATLEDERLRFVNDERLSIRVVRAVYTACHQQAIARALRAIASDSMAPLDEQDVVVVMDADGEDRPQDVATLLSELDRSDAAVVTAIRGKRSESLSFRLSYRAYRVLFALLTGRKLANGNFMAITPRALRQVVPRNTVGIHFAATVMRFGGSVSSVVCDRGSRYAGKSRMNRRSLMLHAFAGISTYGDLVALRLATASFLLLSASIIGLGVSFGVRLLTDLAIPGWATYVSLGFSALAVQSLVVTLTALVLFISATAASSTAQIPSAGSTQEGTPA